MLETSFCGIKLRNCLMNASGVNCSLLSELQELDACDEVSIMVTKSCTLNYREGNPFPRYWSKSNDLSINSTGLANMGYYYYKDIILNKKVKKPCILSVSGLSFNENETILKDAFASNIPFVELNLSCPNIPNHPQMGYDFSAMEQFLDVVAKMKRNSETQIGLKLPGYFDICHFNKAAEIINKFSGVIKWVTSINSIGNGLVIDPHNESVVIKPKQGLGGIGGGCVKATALANVFKFRELLNKDIQIIGCGGVVCGIDVFEHILCGSELVQIGTTLMNEEINYLKRISDELCNLMEQKGYSNLNKFKGKLKMI